MRGRLGQVLCAKSHQNSMKNRMCKRAFRKALPTRVGNWIGISIGYYKNERGAGSESIPRWRLGSLGGTESSENASKNAAAVQLLCTGCTNSHNCSGVTFLLGIFTCLVPPNNPKCPCVADSDPVSHSFW